MMIFVPSPSPVILSLLLGLMLMTLEVSLAAVPCTPAKGKTALLIGQDYKSIVEYSKAMEKPMGYMTYTAINFNSSASLAGLKFPVDYGSGIEWAKGLLDLPSVSSLQIGLYLVNSCGYIMTGLLDAYIDELGMFLKKYPEHSIYLRIGYEFDSEENNYPTVDYVGAFRRIVKRFEKLQVNNTAFVWHASGFKPRDGMTIERNHTILNQLF